MPMKILLASTASLLFVAATALGHGSMADPISRTYQGFLENPQSPQSNAVLAAISVGARKRFTIGTKSVATSWITTIKRSFLMDKFQAQAERNMWD